MDSQAHESEVCRREPPSNPRHSLIGMPTELIFNIIDLALAVGQERDVSALARTNKTMHFIVNAELYRLVIKHKIFYIVNWAAQQDRVDTLKIAFANGGNPNQTRISAYPPHFNRDNFRPVDGNLRIGPSLKLDLAVMQQNSEYRRARGVPALPLVWSHVWFSSARLSIANGPQLDLLSDHYLLLPNTIKSNNGGEFLGKNDTRLVQLSKPLDENFAFPENMSPADMGRREVKIGFLRLFRFWDSPLHLAALHNRSSVTKALLANGADMDCTSTNGNCNCYSSKMPTSMTIARSGNHLAAYTPLHVAICMGNFRAAKVLVAHGAERMALMFTGNDERDWLSENPLHRALSTRAAYGFNYNFIEFLLDHGYAARIEERNHENLTPLLLALNRIGDPAKFDVVGLLLRYGADPNNPGPCSPASEFHQRPLPPGSGDWEAPALWATREGHFPLATFLLNHGADVMARSSAVGDTMLFAACTATDHLVLTHNMPVKWQRMELLDAILANDIMKQDLNRFHDTKNFTPLTELIRFKIFRDPTNHTGHWETKVFGAGADIMAGVVEGKVTPFETMIIDVLDFWILRPSPTPRAVRIGDRILAILKASGINQHRYRPRAILNQLWGYVDRRYRSVPTWFHDPPNIEIIPYILLAFLKAGFSPAEVDSHGDTAMTSFLQQLLKTPKWATRDSKAPCGQGWLLPMIMVMIQEHGAAIGNWNNKGYTAYDYLGQIVNYDGQDEDLVMLRRVMRRSVQPGLDVLGYRCFQFHHMALFGGLSGDTTLERIQGNESHWMPCEHFCRRYCNESSAHPINQQCARGRSILQNFAECDGKCYNPRFEFWDVLWERWCATENVKAPALRSGTYVA